MGIILLVTAAILWGMIGPVSKIMFAGGMTPLESAFYPLVD
jgi:drug/metabolite transporter (DMT)-like permease